MRFEKWQALGNDYVIIEAAALPWELTPERVARICDPHFGVGSDGVLLLIPVEDPAYVAELRIFNPDGSEAELSGNGAREAVLYLRRNGWTDEDTFTITTRAGPITPTIRSDRECTVQMGRAASRSQDFPSGGPDGRGELNADGRNWSFQHVAVGNPQCAIEAGDELESLDLPAIGPGIENNDLFPNRTNVSFYRVESQGGDGAEGPGSGTRGSGTRGAGERGAGEAAAASAAGGPGSRIRARIFERGVGETLSSGTGATGAAIAAFLDGAQSPVIVELDGGELEVEISKQLDVTLTGWAEPICSGELSGELLRALGDA